MNKAKFTNEMIEIIKTIKGKTFCSYDCAKFLDEAYGNIRINLNDFSIEFLNETKETHFWDSFEDISCFSCKKVDINSTFKPYCDEDFQNYSINEKIQQIQIISDTISINNKEYEISFDMAVIINTEKHNYIFSRGWFFGEVISINVDKNYDEIYPVKQVIDDWDDDGKNNVAVSRCVKVL